MPWYYHPLIWYISTEETADKTTSEVNWVRCCAKDQSITYQVPLQNNLRGLHFNDNFLKQSIFIHSPLPRQFYRIRPYCICSSCIRRCSCHILLLRNPFGCHRGIWYNCNRTSYTHRIPAFGDITIVPQGLKVGWSNNTDLSRQRSGNIQQIFFRIIHILWITIDSWYMTSVLRNAENEHHTHDIHTDRNGQIDKKYWHKHLILPHLPNVLQYDIEVIGYFRSMTGRLHIAEGSLQDLLIHHAIAKSAKRSLRFVYMSKYIAYIL